MPQAKQRKRTEDETANPVRSAEVQQDDAAEEGQQGTDDQSDAAVGVPVKGKKVMKPPPPFKK